jgi:hypothetical protein
VVAAVLVVVGNYLKVVLIIQRLYNSYRCLKFFDVLEAHLLDQGDIDGVFGVEELERASDRTSGGLGQWFGQAIAWTEQRIRGYPAVRTRKQTLITQVLQRSHLG